MIEGNIELLQILASWAATAPTVFAIVLFDERRLDPAQLARTWPPVSRDAAVFAMWMMGFSPVYMLVFFVLHFGRTRDSFAGALLGLLWTLVASAAFFGSQVAVAYGVDALGL